jgi:hypothetical protein
VKIEDQIKQFEQCVEDFAGFFALLNKRFILRKVTSWTVRDIAAHLIGWNRYILQGSRQILRGELPFYDINPGADYSNINAELISKYSDTDRSVLLKILADSSNELVRFLRTIDSADWDRDFGVRHKEEKITVKSTMGDLIADYNHHRVQLKELGESDS